MVPGALELLGLSIMSLWFRADTVRPETGATVYTLSVII
jgi:hypothetical protein